MAFSGRVWGCRAGTLALLAGAAGLAGHRLPERGSDAGTVQIVVDGAHPLGPISPLIYGMASPGEAHYRLLRVPLARWGGNPATRYNWERGNAWNAARDWRFANGNYRQTSPDARRPSGSADAVIATARKQGAEFLLTVPTMGWVARDDDSAHFSRDVPANGGAPIAPDSEAIAGYDPTANRDLVSLRSLPRKGRPFADPPDLSDDAVYQDEWVSHLTHRFGPARQGGVRYYAMDNEPDLWDATHTDMRPVAPDYDALLRQFLTTADAVKDVDPGAQITGPVSWGWSGYFFSPRDRGQDAYRTHADRVAHGGQPFLPWFLRQVARHDRQTGQRSLDVLDVHFYPQGTGVYTGQADPSANALRLRSVRALWDPEYTDESWINAPVALLPRLKQWTQAYYPGTRIGLTEWNWGAERTLNGGLAAADVLGTLGRERIDMACYWTAPPPGSPAFLAFQMYRNADGRGHGLGDIALPARSDAENALSCYAARDGENGPYTLLLLNRGAARNAQITLQGANGEQMPAQLAAQTWGYSGANLKSIEALPDTLFERGAARVHIAAMSLTLLRCPAR